MTGPGAGGGPVEPRLPMLDPGEARRRAEQAGMAPQLADLSIFRVLLLRPGYAQHLSDLLLGLLFAGTLDPRLRELVIMRLGWVTGSVYEWTQHWRIAVDLGVTADDLRGVRDWRAYDGFGPVERAVLAAVDDTVQAGAITAETWAELRPHLGDEELVELVAVIGCWHMVSGILRSLVIPLEEGVEPWPPDGQVPGRRAENRTP